MFYIDPRNSRAQSRLWLETLRTNEIFDFSALRCRLTGWDYLNRLTSPADIEFEVRARTAESIRAEVGAIASNSPVNTSLTRLD